jgi:DNA-binding NarL/FixJ family response regulator
MNTSPKERNIVPSTDASGHIEMSDKPRTILIADDSQRVRKIVRRALERDTNFTICGEAADGVEAVTKAKQLVPDLILLDVRMARLNGLEVAGILRQALPNLRIMMVTMYAEEMHASLTSLFRIDDVFSKAEGVTRLIERVRDILAN